MSARAPLLSVRSLSLTYPTSRAPLRALDGVDLDIHEGEVLAVVGESGSGKSSIALLLMGLLAPEAKLGGSALFRGEDLMTMDAERKRALRGRHISIVFQDPFTSLNPSLPIGLQVAEPLVAHLGLGAAEAEKRVIAALAEVGLPSPETLLTAYPHQLSGGMQQRVLIATALISDPELIILDEPTTALDVTVEARILDLLGEIRRRRKVSMLFITHNLGVVNKIADKVCVLYAGRVAELGPKNAVLGSPGHPYTKGLLASIPRLDPGGIKRTLAPIGGRFPDLTQEHPGCIFASRCAFAEEECRKPQAFVPLGTGQDARCWKARALGPTPWPASREDRPVARAGTQGQPVETKGLRKRFAIPQLGYHWGRLFGFLPWPRRNSTELWAVNDVSVDIGPGEVLGVVGESGSGKSTLARLILRLIEPTAGRVIMAGTDVTGLAAPALRGFRKQAQIIFQNPDSSLNPRRTIGNAIARAASLHEQLSGEALQRRVTELLDSVGLPTHYAMRYPHQLSGGEKQRAGIARALATRPSFIACDEPVSALDVSVQATVLNLMSRLQDELGLSYLFISHDLSVVAHIADRIAVMYGGRIVEIGPAEAVLKPPYHPYTEVLLSAIPNPDPHAAGPTRIALRSDAVGQRAALGCPFHLVCPRKIGAVCETEFPGLREVAPGHKLACHIPVQELTALPPVIPTAAKRAKRA
jgi:peptide/nickel transport system ATP-binding protein